MKNIVKFLAVFALFASTQVFAQTARPTQESLNKLFEVTHLQAMLPRVQAQMDSMMNNMMQDSLKGKSITPEQQKALDAFRAKVIKIQKDEMNWEALEPRISEIYQNTLSQADVDGITAFYQSPAGQSYVKKMPEISQQTMTMMQSMMGPILKKIEAAGTELKLDLQRIDQK
ncbi:hypothetical protein AAKU67_001881 [Oxalobacteraceae bacterium GrIS 2.11]